MRRIPVWLKIAYTAFAAAIVPVYARQYGWRNFLWFSDVALLATVPVALARTSAAGQHASFATPAEISCRERAL